MIGGPPPLVVPPSADGARGPGTVQALRTALAPAARRLLWRRTAAPDFLVAGAQKAGTTSLHVYLNGLPSVHPAVSKELDYFATEQARGRRWYAGHFPVVWTRSRSWLSGESSPYYLIHPLAPPRIAQQLPQAKVLVLVRNPVDRAYSQWTMQKSRGQEPGTFEESLELEAQQFEARHAALAADPDLRDDHHRMWSYVARGLYLKQLEHWYRFVPPERVLVLVSEALFREPAAHLERLHAFLGLDDPVGAFPREWVGTYDDRMAADTRSRLERLFAAPNTALGKHLGVDLSRYGWSTDPVG